MMSQFLLELPYEVSEETFEYILAPERCKHATGNDVVHLLRGL